MKKLAIIIAVLSVGFICAAAENDEMVKITKRDHHGVVGMWHVQKSKIEEGKTLFGRNAIQFTSDSGKRIRLTEGTYTIESLPQQK